MAIETENRTEPTENEISNEPINETDKTDENEEEDKGEQPNQTEESKGEDQWDDILGSGGILKKILWEGTPDTRPKRLEHCTLNYECRLSDGTVVESEKDFVVTLGDCEVVQGLDLALGLMNVGEKCNLKIESRLAYGTKGNEPKIPPNAELHYTVELISVKDPEELEELSIIERKARGNKKREKGNWWYGRGENTLAVQCYRRALDYLDEVEGGIKYDEPDLSATDSALQELLEDRMSVCNNMAAAQIKLGLHDAALNSLMTVLRCQPDNIKALYRKAKVLREKNDLAAALKCLQKALEVAPNNADIQKELNSVNSVMQKQKISERELAKRMFRSASTADASKKKEEGGKFKLWVTVCASVVVGLVGLAAYRLKLT